MSNVKCFVVTVVGADDVAIRVLEHSWGTDVAALQAPFDVVVACGECTAQPVAESQRICSNIFTLSPNKWD